MGLSRRCQGAQGAVETSDEEVESEHADSLSQINTKKNPLRCHSGLGAMDQYSTSQARGLERVAKPDREHAVCGIARIFRSAWGCIQNARINIAALAEIVVKKR